MKIEFISSLNNKDQKGGAYLRVKALSEIYLKIGFEKIQLRYLDEFKQTQTIKGFLLSLLLKVNIRSLFTSSTINLYDCEFIHLDNLRFFNWKIKNKKPHQKIIYNAHNLEFESYVPRQNVKSAQRLKELEMKTMNQADYIFVCSEREKNIIDAYDTNIGKKVFVIPNLIDKKNYAIHPEKNIILFVGTLDYYPNVMALDYLINEFYPNLDEEIQGKFRFVVAGRNPALGLEERLSRLGVELRANLNDDELRDLLSKTYISLVPLDHGSGTRLKIIESIFSGSIVLSTYLGSEGIKAPLIINSDLVAFRSKFEELIKKVHKIEIEKLNDFYEEFDIDSWVSKNGEKLKRFLGIL